MSNFGSAVLVAVILLIRDFKEKEHVLLLSQYCCVLFFVLVRKAIKAVDRIIIRLQHRSDSIPGSDTLPLKFKGF